MTSLPLYSCGSYVEVPPKESKSFIRLVGNIVDVLSPV